MSGLRPTFPLRCQARSHPLSPPARTAVAITSNCLPSFVKMHDSRIDEIDLLCDHLRAKVSRQDFPRRADETMGITSQRAIVRGKNFLPLSHRIAKKNSGFVTKLMSGITMGCPRNNDKLLRWQFVERGKRERSGV